MTNNVNDSKNTKLTKNELYNLITRAQAGDEFAMEELYLSHANFITHTVKSIKVNPAGISMEDLVSEGTVAFIKAIHSFDTSKDCALTTYTKLPIEYAVKAYIAENCRPFGVPEKFNRDITTYYAFCNKFYQENCCRATDEDILKNLKWDNKKLGLVRDIIETKYLFLDETPEKDDHKDKEAHTASEVIAYEDDSEELEMDEILKETFAPRALAILTSDEREVVKMRLNFYGRVYTYAEIAEELESNEGKVKRIYDSAIKKLKRVDPKDLGLAG